MDGPGWDPPQREKHGGIDHGGEAAEPVLAVIEDRELASVEHVLAHQGHHGVVRVDVILAEGQRVRRHPDHPDVDGGHAEERGHEEQARSRSPHTGPLGGDAGEDLDAPSPGGRLGPAGTCWRRVDRCWHREVIDVSRWRFTATARSSASVRRSSLGHALRLRRADSLAEARILSRPTAVPGRVDH